MTGRFAPSPTGRMHLGNIYCALLSWLSCKSQGGQWLLRIEDLDPQRSRAEYTDLLKNDLQWLGLDWDLYCVQSERHELYQDALERLKGLGLVYPCYCTRADILATQAPHETDGRVVYRGTCRPTVSNMTQYIMSSASTDGEEERKGALRLIVPDRDIQFEDRNYGQQTVNLAHHCGDFILQRQDGAFAYQLAVVVDDALMGVTEVVRGRDLLLSSAQQIYLYELLGYSVPEFCHLPLLCNEAGQRLCKRDKALDMGELRKNYTREQLLGLLAYLAGLQPTQDAVSLQTLCERFAWTPVPTEDVCCNSDRWS